VVLFICAEDLLVEAMAAQLTRIEIFVVARARLNEWIDLQLV
jgi:hypothetical protein